MQQPTREPPLDKIVDIAVHTTLLNLGFDMSKPVSIQKDISHLRRSREICELIQNRLVATLVLLMLIGTASAAWIGLTIAVADKTSLDLTRILK